MIVIKSADEERKPISIMVTMYFLFFLKFLKLGHKIIIRLAIIFKLLLHFSKDPHDYFINCLRIPLK